MRLMDRNEIRAKAYRRILKAANEGKGVRLDEAEVWVISLDDAIRTAAEEK